MTVCRVHEFYEFSKKCQISFLANLRRPGYMNFQKNIKPQILANLRRPGYMNFQKNVKPQILANLRRPAYMNNVDCTFDGGDCCGGIIDPTYCTECLCLEGGGGSSVETTTPSRIIVDIITITISNPTIPTLTSCWYGWIIWIIFHSKSTFCDRIISLKMDKYLVA